jgi:hypothetical protein
MLKALGATFAGGAARWYLNSHYGRYGQMTQFSIDSVQKTIDCEVLLAGETEPIRIHIGGYQLTRSGEQTQFGAGEISVSRAWMNQLAQELLLGKPLPVPESVARWLAMVM